MQWEDPEQEFSNTERRIIVTEPRYPITGLTRGADYTVQVAAMESSWASPVPSHKGMRPRELSKRERPGTTPDRLRAVAGCSL